MRARLLILMRDPNCNMSKNHHSLFLAIFTSDFLWTFFRWNKSYTTFKSRAAFFRERNPLFFWLVPFHFGSRFADCTRIRHAPKSWLNILIVGVHLKEPRSISYLSKTAWDIARRRKLISAVSTLPFFFIKGARFFLCAERNASPRLITVIVTLSHQLKSSECPSPDSDVRRLASY